MMRWLGALLYCFLFSVLCLISFNQRRSTDLGLVSAHELLPGQLLQAGDVTVLDDRGQIPLLGRYATTLIPARKPVTVQNTAAFPDMAPKEGRMRLIVPIKRAVIEGAPINGPFQVRICHGSNPIGDDLIAVSAGCAGTNGGCSAVVDLAASQAGPIVAAFGKSPVPTLERIDGSCGS